MSPAVPWDVEWYSQVSGCNPTRQSAVRHYLRKGHRKGHSPHPLFDPNFVRNQLGTKVGTDTLVGYLEAVENRALVDPSPLFDVQHYVTQQPEALGYPGGPLAHYLSVGGPAGASPNFWFRPQEGAPDLTSWAKQRYAEWADRHDAVPRDSRAAPPPADNPAGENTVQASRMRAPLVTVVLNIAGDRRLVEIAAQSVLNQEYPNLEILALTFGVEDALPDALSDGASETVSVRRVDGSQYRNALEFALRSASGEYICWLRAGQRWDHRHLARAVLALQPGGAATHCVEQIAGKDLFDSLGTTATGTARYAAQEASTTRLAAGLIPSLGSIVARRSVAVAIGGFDSELPAAHAHDFIYRLARAAPLRLITEVGLISLPRQDWPENDPDFPAVAHCRVARWHEAVIARNHLEWAVLERRDVDQHSVTVVIQARDGWHAAQQTLERVIATTRVAGHAVSVLVIACGLGAHDSLVLDSFPARFPSTSVAHYPADHTPTLAITLALEHIHTAVVVTLDHRCEPDQGWLEPLIAALHDPAVVAAQSLITNPSRSIQSAGYAFPSSGRLPYRFLDGFPTEDASAVGDLSFAALDGGALAFRYADLVRLRGFDPIFSAGPAGVDLCLRATQLTGGRLTVLPDSVVIRNADRTGLSWTAQDRLVFLERWASSTPQDDSELWRNTGFHLVAYAQGDQPKDRRLSTPVPVIGRKRVTDVREHHVFRWAIKNPATADRTTHLWGDTNFANHLAIALRRLGQEVVIDLRPEFERPTGHLDDVVVVLRGLVRYRPMLGQINLLWVMSHPERVTRAELESFDHVFAAGPAWASRMSRRWNCEITPLLQATDPQIFNPDQARPDSGHTILFVGNARATPRPVVMGAIEQGLPVSVYGSGWPAWIPKHHVCATELPNNDLGAAYRSASLVLNDHWDGPRREGFVCNRLFDAVAAGARVISDPVEGIEELFGRSVQVAETPGELADLARHPDYDDLFGTEAERLLVSERVRALHSFDSRARELLDTALRYRHRVADL